MPGILGIPERYSWARTLARFVSLLEKTVSVVAGLHRSGHGGGYSGGGGYGVWWWVVPGTGWVVLVPGTGYGSGYSTGPGPGTALALALVQH